MNSPCRSSSAATDFDTGPKLAGLLVVSEHADDWWREPVLLLREQTGTMGLDVAATAVGVARLLAGSLLSVPRSIPESVHAPPRSPEDKELENWAIFVWLHFCEACFSDF